MRDMTVLAVLAVLALLLAGCQTDPAPVPDDPDQVLEDPDSYYAEHFCVREDVQPRDLAPDAAGDPWVLGDWWQYELDSDSTEPSATRLVYYADQDINHEGRPSHYMVGTESHEEALEHAVFSTNPVVGRIHRLLYSPHEQGLHADMFNFPLCAGNTWDTGFFQRVFSMQAESTDITLPDGTVDAGYLLRGAAPDGSTLEYTYSPTSKWFTELHLDRADGTTIDMSLTGHGSGASGDFFFLRGQKDQHMTVDDADFQETVTMEAGQEGDYDRVGFYLEMEREGNGRVELELVAPDGTVAACVGHAGEGPLQGTQCDASPLLGDLAWQAGDWSIQVDRNPLSDVQISGQARLVSIYDRSGSL